MEIIRQYDQDKKLMVVHFPAVVTDASLLQFIRALNTQVEGIDDLRQLSICTGIKDVSQLTFDGVAQCASDENSRHESKLAILVANESIVHVFSLTYKYFANWKRKEIRLFSRARDALKWIASDENEFAILNNKLVI